VKAYCFHFSFCISSAALSLLNPSRIIQHLLIMVDGMQIVIEVTETAETSARESVHIDREVVTALDEHFPALYSAAHAAATVLDENDATEPALIALDLRNQVSQLHGLLQRAGLLDVAALA
jgi:hypothetical protein